MIHTVTQSARSQHLLCLVWTLLLTGLVYAQTDQPIPTGIEGFESSIAPFLKQNCIRCHGPEKNKGKVTLHTLDGDLSKGRELETWDSVLDMLESGEMPPIDEPQPSKAQVKAVRQWIESGMRDHAARAAAAEPQAGTRRLTNVEYQNTLSDLLGFELDVIDDLPEDPEHYYHFNNTAELMRIGPEQLDRYLEVARGAMRGAIVGPGKPTVIKARREWKPTAAAKGKPADEIGASMDKFGHIDTLVVPVTSPPLTGEFRVRLSAAARLLTDIDEAPLQLILGTPIDGDHNEKAHRVIGTAHLTNPPEEPRVLEYRGRIENIPFSLGAAAGRKPAPTARDGAPVQRRELRAQLIYDDGTLNDGVASAQARRLSMLRAVVNWMEFEAPVIDTWPPRHHTDILFESPLRARDEAAYVRAVLERFMTRAYRGPVAAAEVERFAQVYRLVRPGVDSFEEAVRETLAMVLVSPRFLYHTESDPQTDEHHAMACRLSYFLWASMPDAALLDLAVKKRLNDPAVIEQQALRMLSDEKSLRFVRNFTMQWLSLKKSLTVPINRELYPRFLHLQPTGETAGTEKAYRPSTRDYMIQETIGFVHHLIRENKGALSIVDSDFAILNERLAAHYGVPGVKGMRMRPVAIKPEHHLGGLLTHGSVLIGNGTGTAPHPIYRAVWLREAILGDTVAPPPSEVPALSDSAGASLEKALSIAQLLAKHRTVESCNDCHFRLDPWGIPFEEYNAIGQFQTRVPKDGTRVQRYDPRQFPDLASYQGYLDSISTVEVSAKAGLPHGPEVNGVAELKAYLLKERKDDIVQNVVRRLLSYGIGRHLTYHDRFAVQVIVEEAKKKDLGMRDIIVSICKSDVFRAAPPHAKDRS